MTRVYLVFTDLITIWKCIKLYSKIWSSRQKKKSRWKARKAMGIILERIVCWRHRRVGVRGSGQRRQTWEVGRILEAGHNLPKDLLFTVGHGRHWCHFGRSPEVWLGSCGAFIAWPSGVTTFSFSHFWPRAFCAGGLTECCSWWQNLEGEVWNPDHWSILATSSGIVLALWCGGAELLNGPTMDLHGQRSEHVASHCWHVEGFAAVKQTQQSCWLSACIWKEFAIMRAALVDV